MIFVSNSKSVAARSRLYRPVLSHYNSTSLTGDRIQPINRSFIEAYAAGGKRLGQSIAGVSPQQLIARPPESAGVGLWSIQQIVIHLADCEAVYADRMKRIIAEDNPPLLAFDENLWTARLYYHDQSVEEALSLIDLTRRQMARVFRKLSDADFERAGVHSETGPKTLLNLIHGSDKHMIHHLDFIPKKRRWMTTSTGAGQ